MGGQVPGRQTTPRAELWAAIQFLSRASTGSYVEIGIDASYVTRGVIRRNQLAKGENGDLWSLFFQLIDEREGATHLYKIKSHLEDQGESAITEGLISSAHMLGNSLADAAAEQANEMVQPKYATIKEAEEAEVTAFLVAKRIAIIQAHVWQSQGDEAIYEAPRIINPVAPCQKRATAATMLRLVRNGHRLHRTGTGYMRCENCGRKRAASNSKYWLSTKCVPITCAHVRVEQSKGISPPPSHTKLIEEEDTTEGLGSETKAEDGVAALIPASKYVTSCLDDPEADMEWQSEPEPQENVSQQKREVSEDRTPRCRRLFKKTPFSETGFGPPPKEMVTKRVARGLKRKAKEAIREQNKLDKKSELQAWQIAKANIEAVNGMLDKFGHQDASVMLCDVNDRPHQSHRLCKVGSIEAIYCTRCAGYASKSSLRLLSNECRGSVPKSSSRNFRLLQLGILPKEGARVPPAQSKKRKRCW